MVSLSVSSEYVLLTFVSKVLVLRRLPDDRLVEERVLVIDEAKADTVNSITDGATTSVCSALSRHGKLFAAASGKKLMLWDTNGWKGLGFKNIIRAASCVAFTYSEDTLLLSDKSGDAYLFKIESLKDPEIHENELLLGHVSMLLRIDSSPDDRFVVTCDRDEKIRVSHLPNGYNIQTYCLGHTDAVTCFDIPSIKSKILISGSSDGTIRFWEYATGKQLLNYVHTCGEEKALIVDLVTMPFDDESVLVCVILKKKSSITLLKVDFSGSSMSCRHLEDVPTPCTSPISLVAHGNELFVLSVDSPNFVTAFRYSGQCLVLNSSLNDHLRASLGNYKDDFIPVTENIADDRLFNYLNKRKIDDTQEYYKRKQERLLSNSN